MIDKILNALSLVVGRDLLLCLLLLLVKPTRFLPLERLIDESVE